MEDFSILITNWYRQNGRDLPWRTQNEPYKIWLSEIILQQTRVDQGLDYYRKFVEHYPTVSELANATEDEVLRDWQGLGYYSRARNLHTTAKYIVHELDSVFPASYEDVLALKGVGEYTAAAICSFSYNLPHAVVDGNVYRVLSRYLNLAIPIDSTQGKKTFKEAAHELLDKSDPATHNQAIMELGALVCKPQRPDCENCPLIENCLSYAAKTQSGLPVKEKKIKVRARYFHYLILKEDNTIILKKRDTSDIWGGLYDFPLIEMEGVDKPSKAKLDEIGVAITLEDGTFKHILSHQHIHATFWLAEITGSFEGKNYVRVKSEELSSYPMPQLLIRYLESSNEFKAD